MTMFEHSVVHPLLAFMGLVLFVFAPVMVTARVYASVRGLVPKGYFGLLGADKSDGEKPAVPRLILQLTRNYANLMEIPTFFLVMAVLIVTLGFDGEFYAVVGWAFVATRVAHTILHTTCNPVLPRLAAFLAGIACLGVMLVALAGDVLSKYSPSGSSAPTA